MKNEYEELNQYSEPLSPLWSKIVMTIILSGIFFAIIFYLVSSARMGSMGAAVILAFGNLFMLIMFLGCLVAIWERRRVKDIKNSVDHWC